jgi:hypothetical protein
MGSEVPSVFRLPASMFHVTSFFIMLSAEPVLRKLGRRLVAEGRVTPPLVEHGGLQALYLSELVSFGDVVDFDEGHGYLKSSLIMSSCIRALE